MMLTCEKCGRKQPLTDEDVAFFHPRFFCLSCGAKLPFKIDEKELAALRASNDRNRRVADVSGLPAEDTVRRVHRGAGDGGPEGGG
jgi:hypothetical protein